MAAPRKHTVHLTEKQLLALVSDRFDSMVDRLRIYAGVGITRGDWRTRLQPEIRATVDEINALLQGGKR
jgi:hypothetical protein